jgi:hypothetical protein
MRSKRAGTGSGIPHARQAQAHARRVAVSALCRNSRPSPLCRNRHRIFCGGFCALSAHRTPGRLRSQRAGLLGTADGDGILEELQGRLEELQGRLEELQGRLEELQGRDGMLEELQGRLEELQGRDGMLEELQGRLEELQGRDGMLEER